MTWRRGSSPPMWARRRPPAFSTSLRRRVARKELNDVDALLRALERGDGRNFEAGGAAARHRSADQALRDPGRRHQRRRQDHHHRQTGASAPGRGTQRACWPPGDTFRAAAREQLDVWAERNGVPIIAQPSRAPNRPPSSSTALQAAQARNIDVLIADTAGRLHTQTHLMDELKKVKRVLGRHRPGGAARSAAGARRHHRPKRASPRPRSSTRAWASPAWSSPSSTAPPRAASCSRSRRNWAFPSASSASARTNRGFRRVRRRGIRARRC